MRSLGDLPGPLLGNLPSSRWRELPGGFSVVGVEAVAEGHGIWPLRALPTPRLKVTELSLCMLVTVVSLSGMTEPLVSTSRLATTAPWSVW